MILNWVDWIIVAVLLYYLWEGWAHGVVAIAVSLVSFLGSLWLAIRYHAIVGAFLGEKFGIPAAWTTVLGYIVVGFMAEFVLAEILAALAAKLPRKLLDSRVNKMAGALTGGINSLVLMAFLILVMLALPLRGTIKKDIKASVIGRRLVIVAEKYGGQVKSVLDEATKEAIRFLTIQPTSKERIALDVAPSANELAVDKAAEQQMLALVNAERAKAGVQPLQFDTAIAEVARAHSRDMFIRRYFAHINPEGEDVGDRLEKAGVPFTIAGENLAYAPDVTTAHRGLMESEGHKHNILDPQFTRIGIGIINTETYGMMVTQNFTN